jgi:stalled ribosome rescue protein Dom34
MKTKKSIGVWMDHSIARLIEFTTEPMQIRNIESSFTHEIKSESIEKSEKHMHNKEQGEQLEYYHKILKGIESYDQVLIFGPTEAKNELRTLLRADHAFDNISLEILQTDKMSENQLFAFVRNHFSEHQRVG